MEKQIEILGYIDCPTCGTDDGMRITRDKNGHPFGWCEKSCGQQLRVGPDPRRVRDFFKLYPQLTGRTAEPVKIARAEPPVVPAQVQPIAAAEKQAKKRSSFDDVAELFGIK